VSRVLHVAAYGIPHDLSQGPAFGAGPRLERRVFLGGQTNAQGDAAFHGVIVLTISVLGHHAAAHGEAGAYCLRNPALDAKIRSRADGLIPPASALMSARCAVQYSHPAVSRWKRT